MFNTPLARWGFPVLAVLAWATDQPLIAVVCALFGVVAWKDHRNR